MSILTLFLKMREMEQKTGEFYLLVYQKFAHRDPDIAKFFEILSKEETVHEKEVDLARNFFEEAQDSFKEVKNAVEMIDEILETVKKKRDYFIKNADSISSKEILNIALEIELDLEARHQEFYYSLSDEKLKNFLKYLILQDDSHVNKLKKKCRTEN